MPSHTRYRVRVAVEVHEDALMSEQTTPLYSQHDTNPGDFVRNETVAQEYILSLDNRQATLQNVGGKGASLARLLRVGMPVPGGFHVTTAAYERFVAENDLESGIQAALEKVDASKPGTLTKASEKIGDLFLRANLPEEVSGAISQAYAGLDQDGLAVAVRSSATMEDLPGASFAGQQATSLNVRGEGELLGAVRRCWASLWSARAIAYRERQGFDHEAVTMGVVVQAMVAADISGVLFTANPNTGARCELVVNASFGLGEAIVSGEVTPDTYVLDRESLISKETRLGTKEVMIVAADGQGTDNQNTITKDVPEAQRGESALFEALLGELGALGLRVEEYFGGVPQDIEWAVADGRCWLLQARPITNLPPAPLRDVRWEPPRPGTVWMRRQVVEHMPEPLSPLFDELYLHEGLDQSIREITIFMSDLFGFEFDIWDFVQPPFAATVNGYAYSVASFDFRWRLVLPILRIYATALPRMLRYMLPHWRDEALPGYLATIERWKGINLDDASDAELLQGVRELAMADAVYWFAAAVPLALARITDAALDRFLKSATAERGSSNGLRPTSGPYLRGFPSKAVDAQAQLEAIARDIHGSEALRNRVVARPAGRLIDTLAQHPEGKPILDALQHYLDEYGHQIYNLDFVAPTQADDPLPVLLSLKAAVEHPERDTRAHQAELAQEREALVESTSRSLNPLRRRLFRLLVNWAQRFTPYREVALFYVGAGWPTLRQLALELGRRLTEAGSLNAPGDVFYLKSAELTSASVARSGGQSLPELAQLAQERHQLREARKRLDPPVTIPPGARFEFGPVKLSLFEPQPRGAGEGPTLYGFAVSPGQVTAAASIVRSPEDFDKMAQGTILDCPTTTPAWTPLFSQAKGLVTDIGGTLAHGSIVAREYGIPAVMGTGNATHRIEGGQSIQVDGDAGTVTLVDVVGTGAPVEAVTKKSGISVRKVGLAALAAGVVGLIFWRKRRR
jgi:rifampicin phosphotransferase